MVMNVFFSSVKKTTLLMLFFSLVLIVGCASGPRPKPWVLSINKTTTASIQVDLIGITASEQPYWEGYNLDKYWSDGDRRRAEADKLTQTLLYNKPWRVEMTNAKWQEWFNRGATQLLIIANLPGSFDSGPADPRRLIIPLDKHAWKTKDNTIEIQVQDTILSVLTPQKPR